MQEERLSTFHKLWKNYGPNCLAMITRRSSLSSQLDDFTFEVLQYVWFLVQLIDL